MNIRVGFLGLIIGLVTIGGCSDDSPPAAETSFTLVSITSDNGPVGTTMAGVSTSPEIVATFSAPIDRATASTAIALSSSTGNLALTYTFSNGDSTVTITPNTALAYFSRYNFQISTALTSVNKKALGGNFDSKVITTFDPADKFPTISDDDLLTLTQKQTFKYFWDLADPASGMALERKGSGPTVTSGGSGFGIMAIVVAMDREFITRTEGVDRLNKIVTFLETADRFHGAWSHWINGSTGKVIPFSTKDDGGDLVETSFLMQGLLTARQYLEQPDTVGNNLIRRITKLYEGVEWDWYRKDGQEVLYWHWSPKYNWDMNFALSGYFEEQITYILAAASPTHGIPKSVYTNGYGQNGGIKTGQKFYGYTLPLGTPSPLFWVQYSYLGMDPHFKDDYADYWEQNVNATLINHAYCVANPRKYVGYSDVCWGLTASDDPNGYDAHSPSNDNGVITPTAALSSFPYAPDESMKALKFFYYTLGDKLWGPYGFYDAFDLSEGWIADSYLAIDQGPIVVMIENYRTGLLWNLFMSAPEIQTAKTTLDLN